MTLRTKKTKRAWRKLLVTAVCLFALWSFGAWLSARMLQVKADLPAADAIVILSGPATYLERVDWAAKLFHEGRAPLILVTNEGLMSGWSRTQERNLYFYELAANELQRRQVPATKIQIVSQIGAGTFQECLRVREFAIEHGLKRLLVVTSAYHSRRALWSMHRVVEGRAIELGMSSPPAGWQTPRSATWWLYRWGWQVVAAEYVKLIYYRWKY